MEGALDRALSHGHSGVVSLSALSLDLSSVCVSLWKLLETEYSLVAILVVSLSALSLDLSSVCVSLWKLLETEYSLVATLVVSLSALSLDLSSVCVSLWKLLETDTLLWPHWWCLFLHCLWICLLFLSACGSCWRQSTLT